MHPGNTGGLPQPRGRYSPSSPTREEEEDEIQEVVIEEEALPSRIFDCPGTVVIYQAMAGSGILEVEDGGGKAVYCFFLASQLQGFLRHHLRAGDKVSVHARLVTAGSKVPYLASSLWLSGSPPPGDDALKALLTPAPPPLLEKYLSLSEDLALELPSPGATYGGGRGQKRTPEMRQRSNSRNRATEAGPVPEKRAKKSSGFVEADTKEVWGPTGILGKVDQYLSANTGLVTVQRGNDVALSVLFHVNQVWAFHSFGPSPFLETQPLANLKLALPPGAEVFLNGRQVSGVEGVDLQATAIWTSRQPPPYMEKANLQQELRLRMSEHLFHTTKEEQYKVNPLTGAGDLCVLGTVVEFITEECGLIRMEGTQDSALFHLEQIWRKGKNGLEPMLPKLSSNLKDCALPLGSKVFVNVRRLPTHSGSCFSYQAILLWQHGGSDSGPQPLPPPYLAKYKPLEARRDLVARLDELHNRAKAALHLDFQQPSYAQPGPVHCVVDTVSSYPSPTKARVTAVQGDHGLITLFTVRQEEIPVLFHIEDVWDAEGVPALKSSITMQDLQLAQVEVICRTMPGLETRGSLDLVQMAARFRGAPLLQAIAVVVVGGQVKASACPCPRPTKLREMPGWFGNPGGAFFLAPTLAARLNIKVAEWAETARPGLSQHLPLLVKEEELDRLQQAKTESSELDTHNLGRFVCGEWNSMDVEEVVRTALPETLEGHRVKIKYLHRPVLRAEWGLGEVEVMSGTSDPQQVLRMFSGEEVNNPPPKAFRTYVLFRLADYKFFTTPDYFAGDLANVLPITSTDVFFVHAKRVLAKGPVPYVATALWNETLRRELGIEETPTERGKLDHKAVVAARKLVAALDTKKVQHTEKISMEVDDSPEDVPDFIGTACSEVVSYSKKWLLAQGGSVLPYLEGEEGRVLEILTDHLAIVTIREKRRVLVSSEDTFSLEKDSKFSTPKELFLTSVRKRDLSLRSVLQPGSKVFLNAVPLISLPPNAAQVHYTSCGMVLATKNPGGPPIHSIPSSKVLTEEFRLFYMKVLKELDENAKLDSASPIHTTNHPVKIPRRALPGLKTGWLKKETMSREVKETHQTESASTQDVVKKQMIISSTKDEDNPNTKPNKPRWTAEQKKEAKAKKSIVLPTPVSSVEPAAPVVIWESLLSGNYGQVLRIIDKNYGLAVGFLPAGTTFIPFQMLFDTFDVFLGDQTCSELGKKLSDVMIVGDYIKFNAAKVESEMQETKVREVPYMTTAMVVAKTVDEIKAAAIPNTAAVVTSLDQVTKEKIANFRTVTNFLGNKKLTSKEEAMLEEITRGDLANQVLVPQPDPTRGIDDETVLEDSGSEGTDEEEGEDQQNQEDEDDEEIMIVEERHVGVVKELQQVVKTPKPKSSPMKSASITEVSESNLKAAEANLDKLSKELRPSELRKVLMAYIGMLPRTENRAIDVVKLRESSQPEMKIDFLKKFLLSLGEVCQAAKAGLKVGHVFITASQVALIQERGATDHLHLTRVWTETQDSDPLETLSPNILRKVLLGFVKLIEGKTTLEQLGLDTGVATDLKRVLMSVVNICKENIKKEGNKGFKLQNIFINTNQATQIANKGSAVLL